MQDLTPEVGNLVGCTGCGGIVKTALAVAGAELRPPQRPWGQILHSRTGHGRASLQDLTPGVWPRPGAFAPSMEAGKRGKVVLRVVDD